MLLEGAIDAELELHTIDLCFLYRFPVQSKRDEQMLKRRNMTVEPESPLTESNKQV